MELGLAAARLSIDHCTRGASVDQSRTLTQAKLGVRLSFEFGPKQVKYAMRDFSGERHFSVPYEVINLSSPSVVVVNNPQFVRIMSIVIVVGLVAAGAMPTAFPGISRGLVQDLQLICLGLFATLWIGRLMKLFAIKYTLLQMSPQPPGAENHPLRIIHGKSHGAVFDELKSRWKVRVKQLYATVNISNDPAKEIARMAWLKEIEVIDDREYDRAVQQIEAMRQNREPATAALN